jgi:DNA-binding response OmpR family regulator
MLLREVWKYKFVPKTNLVDVHMGRLRRKIDGPHEPPMILNVRGKGFILRIEVGSLRCNKRDDGKRRVPLQR